MQAGALPASTGSFTLLGTALPVDDARALAALWCFAYEGPRLPAQVLKHRLERVSARQFGGLSEGSCVKGVLGTYRPSQNAFAWKSRNRKQVVTLVVLLI